jgi:hypothetical protein
VCYSIWALNYNKWKKKTLFFSLNHWLAKNHARKFEGPDKSKSRKDRETRFFWITIWTCPHNPWIPKWEWLKEKFKQRLVCKAKLSTALLWSFRQQFQEFPRKL